MERSPALGPRSAIRRLNKATYNPHSLSFQCSPGMPQPVLYDIPALRLWFAFSPYTPHIFAV